MHGIFARAFLYLYNTMAKVRPTYITTDKDIQVYTSNIHMLVDKYIQENDIQDDKEISDNFMHLIIYLSKYVKQIADKDSINLLDSIFDTYIELCSKYKHNPTVEQFSLLVGTHNNTIKDWKNGKYRESSPEYMATVKKWHNVCKSFLLDDTSNSKITNATKIFILKSAYGMVETAPVSIEEYNRRSANALPDLYASDGHNAIDTTENS